ncbi:MAG: pyridoxine 5'-phosphate synthase [Gemmatimonadota bacterium]
MPSDSFSHFARLRLCVNIDHVATVRQARGTDEPDPVRAAVLAELAGADGITVHLREDRRHIQDRDVVLLLQTVRTTVNLELAAAESVLALAEEWRAPKATLVPEKREEVTTEGGLDMSGDPARLKSAIERLNAAGSRVALFVDPDARAIDAAAELGPDAVELHTGEYANAAGRHEAVRELARLRDAAARASAAGLAVHAGHGLTYENVAPVAAIEDCEELNIGHSIVSRAVLVGMERAVREMAESIRRVRT